MGKSAALYIDYGTTRIPFLLRYSKRKTLGIMVTPDKKVTITAPMNSSQEKILRKIEGKAGWISKQIRKFDSYERTLTRRNPEYVSGETFYYLGRKYRLKVIAGEDESVKIHGRYLHVTVNKKTDQKRIKDLLMDWYMQQAKEVFSERLKRAQYILKREKIAMNQLLVRKMEKRWGSCTEMGNIVLNMSLIQASMQCIDYVVVHEVCHLKYMDHGEKFYRLIERYSPEWEHAKQKLTQVDIL